MDLQELTNHIRLHLEENPSGIAEHLKDFRPVDVADLLNRLSVAEATKVLTLIPVDEAAGVLNESQLRRRGRLLEGLEPKRAAQLLLPVSADQRVDILQEISPHECRRLVPELPAELRAEAEQLFKYPEESAGGIMTTEVVRLDPAMTVAQALDQVRATARDHEHVYACYVIAPDTKQLVGSVSLRDLVMAESTCLLSEVMHPRPISVGVLEERRSVAEKISRYNVLAVPVLEADGSVVGNVTVDDIIDVLVEEQTDSVLRMGAVEPGALDEPYLEVSLLRMVRKRGVWLVVLFLGEMLTATAMGFFEDEIAKAVVLALFVPLIISSGGNSGSQAATIVIRALALGEVRLRDWWRVMRRELASGLALGILLGTIGFLRIALWTLFTPIYGPQWPLIGLTVGLSLIGVVLWGSLSGSLLPLLLRRLGFDPATSSAPFVATLVDVTGLIIYFSVAFVLLQDTLLKPE